MSPIRALATTRVSMQRPGYLIAVTDAAHDTRAIALEGIATAYRDRVTTLVPIPSARVAEFQSYVREQRLKQRYPDYFSGSPVSEGARVELQDLWLADQSAVPSSSGAVTPRSAADLPPHAAELQFVRAKNYTKTDRGRALLALSRDSVEALHQRLPSPNLLHLTIGQRAFLLYCFLEADYDLVRAIYRLLLPNDTFTRADVSACLPQALLDVEQDWAKSARQGSDRQRVLRLRELRREIELSQDKRANMKPGDTWGGARPPESTGTVRLEPYVDFGVLAKKSRARYHYHLAARQREFFAALVSAPDPGEHLQAELVGSYLRAATHDSWRRLDIDDVWPRIESAHSVIRSKLGYAAFKEVSLLAVAQLLDEGNGGYFEIADALQAIQEAKAREPRRIRFGVARGGGVTSIKIGSEVAR